MWIQIVKILLCFQDNQSAIYSYYKLNQRNVLYPFIGKEKPTT